MKSEKGSKATFRRKIGFISAPPPLKEFCKNCALNSLEPVTGTGQIQSHKRTTQMEGAVKDLEAAQQAAVDGGRHVRFYSYYPMGPLDFPLVKNCVNDTSAGAAER